MSSKMIHFGDYHESIYLPFEIDVETLGTELNESLKHQVKSVAGQIPSPVALQRPLKAVKLEVASHTQQSQIKPDDYVKLLEINEKRELQTSAQGDVPVDQLFTVAQRKARNDARLCCDNEEAEDSYVERHGNVVGIVGEAGVGKTTLCKMMAMLLLNGQILPAGTFMFYIPVKNINFSKKTNFLRFLLSCCLPHWKHDGQVDEELLKLLMNDPNVVFIFDGLDESSKHFWMETSFSVNLFDEATPDIFIKNLMNGSLFPKARKLVASRTDEMLSIPPDFRPRYMFEVLGLSKESQNDLGQQICGDRFIEIQEFLMSNPNVSASFHIPVYYIVTLVFLLKNMGTDATNITNILVSTCCDYARTTQMRNEICDLLGLAKLAWNGFKCRKTYFEERDLQEAGVSHETIQSFLKTSVVDLTDIHLTILEGDKRACFSHLVWQEFFAACHMMLSLSFEEFSSALSKLHGHRWQYVAKFAIGLSDVNVFDKFRRIADCDVDLWKSKKKAMARFLIPAMQSLSSAHTSVALSTRLALWKHFMRKLLRVCSWLHEANDDAITRAAAVYFPIFFILEGNILPSDMVSFCYMMQACGNFEFFVNFGKEVLQSSKRAFLQKSQAINMKILQLFVIEPMEFPDMAELIANSLHKISHLSLEFTNLTPRDVRLLAESLEARTTNIDTLNLSHNRISDEAAICLARSVGKVNALHLYCCEISNAGLAEIVDNLAIQDEPMKALHIGRNWIGDEGARLLCRCLHNVRTLGLGDCRITEAGVKEMAQALKRLDQPMKFLNLANNKMGLYGAKALCRCLHNFQLLSLCNCDIPEAGRTAITRELERLNLPMERVCMRFNR